jgi:arylsulfatase A-like enzyme
MRDPISRREAIGRTARAGAGFYALSTLPLLARCVPGLGRPNILFIFSDDHAPHAISAYGSRINRTPNIDRIANEGAIFLNSFCTNSICAPSRATPTGRSTTRVRTLSTCRSRPSTRISRRPATRRR